jgi:hypothetical protein
MSRYVATQPSTLLGAGPLDLTALRELVLRCDIEGFSGDALVLAELVDAGLRIVVREQD